MKYQVEINGVVVAECGTNALAIKIAKMVKEEYMKKSPLPVRAVVYKDGERLLGV